MAAVNVRSLSPKVTKAYDQLFPGDLRIDSDVQRFYNPKWAAQIEASWDPLLVGTIVVSRRANGDLFVIDGWHRVKVAERQDEAYILDCEVYEGLTKAQEAKRFLSANRDRKGVHQYDLFRVGLKAREWVYLEMQRQVTSRDLVIARTPYKNQVAAIAQCKRIVELDRKTKMGLLAMTLMVCENAWTRDKDTWDNRVLLAIAQVIHRNRDNIDLTRLTRVLGRAMVFQWKARSDGKTKGGGGSESRSTAMARLVVEDYNSGLRTASKLIK
jgi:hypothetical protein